MTAQTETPQQAAPGSPDRRWHYAITLQWQGDRGIRYATYSGVATPDAAVTRFDLFAWVVSTTREHLGAPDDACVTFASIAPDELS